MGPSLMDRHLREHVAMVIARRFVAQEVGHAQQRPWAEAALNLPLNVVGEGLDGLRAQIGLWHLVQGLFEEGHAQHAPQGEHRVGGLGANSLLEQLPRDWLPGRVPGVLCQPGSVPTQRVKEHGLVLGVSHAGGRPLLGEERRALDDVGKVGGMTALVHQSGEGGVPGPDGTGSGQRGKVGLARLEVALGVHVSALGPVAEPVGVLALPVQQVELHGRPAVLDPQRSEGPRPRRDGLLERKVRVLLLRHVASKGLAGVPRLEGGLALFCGEPGARVFHDGSRPLLQGPQKIPKQGCLGETFRHGAFVVIEVHVAHGLGELVAHLHHLHELLRDCRPDRPSAVVSGLARLLVLRGGHSGAQ
mmetsp:Transcript_4524/g.13701  ORF Transcript_4524/g.13701 Transcript_4524/m.13701 type:complete len:360 (-) Transcript_4524:234-1313(-)